MKKNTFFFFSVPTCLLTVLLFIDRFQYALNRENAAGPKSWLARLPTCQGKTNPTT